MDTIPITLQNRHGIDMEDEIHPDLSTWTPLLRGGNCNI